VNQDPDLLLLESCTAAGTRVGYAEELIGASFIGMRTLTVTAPNVAYVIFGGRPPAGGGSTVYADNFAYDAVPTGTNVYRRELGAPPAAAGRQLRSRAVRTRSLPP
jgi:hypothetical protein